MDIAQVTGTGPGGRISRDDVKAHAKAIIRRRDRVSPRRRRPAAAPDCPTSAQWGEVEREP